MPQRVVDDLEIVEIEQDHADLPAALLPARERGLETVDQQRAIEQAGKGIVHRLVLECLAILLVLGDVAALGEVVGLPHLRGDDGDRERSPDDRAVGTQVALLEFHRLLAGRVPGRPGDLHVVGMGDGEGRRTHQLLTRSTEQLGQRIVDLEPHEIRRHEGGADRRIDETAMEPPIDIPQRTAEAPGKGADDDDGGHGDDPHPGEQPARPERRVLVHLNSEHHCVAGSHENGLKHGLAGREEGKGIRDHPEEEELSSARRASAFVDAGGNQDRSEGHDQLEGSWGRLVECAGHQQHARDEAHARDDQRDMRDRILRVRKSE